MMTDMIAEMPIRADGKPTLQAQADWESRCSSFIRPSSQGKVKQLSWKSPLEPNAESMRALDHALRAGTDGSLDLAKFKSSGVGPLSEHEVRYYRNSDELPAAFALDLGFKRRACIENTKTDTKRLEVLWAGPRFLLHTTTDEGSIGRPARIYLFGPGGLKGHNWSDPAHRRFNWWGRDVRRTGCQDMRLETTIVMSIRKGPWSGAANYWKLRKCAARFFSTRTHADQVYTLLYDDICKDRYKNKPPAAVGSVEHMRETFEWARTCPAFFKKGGKVKRSRFFDWSHNCPELAEWWSVIALVLVVYGLEQGYYQDIRSTPMHNNSVDPNVDSDCDSEQGSNVGASDSSDNNDDDDPELHDKARPRDLESKREKTKCSTKSHIHLCANVLTNRATKAQLLMWYYIPQSEVESHDLMMTQTKTQTGRLEWWVSMASNEWVANLTSVIGVFFDEAKCTHIGFISECHLEPDDPERIEQQHFADLFLDIAFATMESICDFGSAYGFSIPECFGALLNTNSSEMEAKTKYLSSMWLTLEKWEKAALSDPFAADLVSYMMWPRNAWAREVMVGIQDPKLSFA